MRSLYTGITSLYKSIITLVRCIGVTNNLAFFSVFPPEIIWKEIGSPFDHSLKQTAAAIFTVTYGVSANYRSR